MTIKHLATFVALTCALILLSGLLSPISAQTNAAATALEIRVEADRVQFATQGDAQEMRVEVFSPAGDLVFTRGPVFAQSVEWNMLDVRGERVADGVYVAIISLRLSSGKWRKHSEQFTISRPGIAATPNSAATTGFPNAPNVAGTGTAGKIAKWIDNIGTLDDSVITENATNIGINTNPNSVLHVLGTQPTAAAGDGTNATRVLIVSGGKGGDTTGSSTTAGTGASVSILAGAGGDAPAGSTNGRGGDIDIRPGKPGAGAGTVANYGNLFLAQNGGNVGVGTNTPTEKLTVANGSIKIRTAGNGLIFPDNSVQTTAAAAEVQHDATLNGNGSAASPLSVADMGVTGAKISVPLALTGNSASATLFVVNSGSGPAISARGAIDTLTQYNLGGQRFLSVAGAFSTFVGVGAGLHNTTGARNTFVGLNAGNANTTGSINSFFGENAGAANTTGSANSFFGRSAGEDNTTAGDNSFFGFAAGANNTTGSFNAFFGRSAGAFNTTGFENTFVGSGAGVSNTTGHNNAFVGAYTGSANTTGSNNTFVGANTGLANTTGIDNTFVGSGAGRSNTTGVNNSFFGRYAGEDNTAGFSNSFFGTAAGESNTIGVYNSFFGSAAGRVNTTGGNNSFFGTTAGHANTTGGNNSFFGKDAGRLNTTGAGNSFFGKESGLRNTIGHNNAFFGKEAGIANTLGSSNAFFGSEAGIANTMGHRNAFFGLSAGASNTTGDGNAFFGHFAGYGNIAGTGNTSIGAGAGSGGARGNYNTFIGYEAEGAANINNATAIGAGARVTTSNTMVLGPSGPSAVTVQVPGRLSVGGFININALGTAGSMQLCLNLSDQLATCSSSLRYKKEVQPFISGLEIVHRLRPISFTWRDHPERDLGLAAEEVAEIEPLLVTRNAEGTIEGVKYDHLNVVLINAVQQQQAQIKQQQEQIKQQQSEIEGLKKLVCLNHPQAQVCQEMK